jgi:hypothetical protein
MTGLACWRPESFSSFEFNSVSLAPSSVRSVPTPPLAPAAAQRSSVPPCRVQPRRALLGFISRQRTTGSCSNGPGQPPVNPVLPAAMGRSIHGDLHPSRLRSTTSTLLLRALLVAARLPEAGGGAPAGGAPGGGAPGGGAPGGDAHVDGVPGEGAPIGNAAGGGALGGGAAATGGLRRTSRHVGPPPNFLATSATQDNRARRAAMAAAQHAAAAAAIPAAVEPGAPNAVADAAAVPPAPMAMITISASDVAADDVPIIPEGQRAGAGVPVYEDPPWVW